MLVGTDRIGSLPGTPPMAESPTRKSWKKHSGAESKGCSQYSKFRFKWEENSKSMQVIENEHLLNWIRVIYTNFMWPLSWCHGSIFHLQKKDPAARCTSEMVGVHPIGGVGTRWSAGGTQVTAATRKPMGIWVAPLYHHASIVDVCRFLGGGNSNIFYVHPETWGNDPNWLIFFKGVETTNQICMFLDSFSGSRISKLFVYFSGQDKHLRRHAVYTQRLCIGTTPAPRMPSTTKKNNQTAL